jgi:hypothetical protein
MLTESVFQTKSFLTCLYGDLLWCYRIVFGLVRLNFRDFFEWNSTALTRGHKFKLFKHSCSKDLRNILLCEQVANVSNSLPAEIIDFNNFIASIEQLN